MHGLKQTAAERNQISRCHPLTDQLIDATNLVGGFPRNVSANGKRRPNGPQLLGPIQFTLLVPSHVMRLTLRREAFYSCTSSPNPLRYTCQAVHVFYCCDNCNMFRWSVQMTTNRR